MDSLTDNNQYNIVVQDIHLTDTMDDMLDLELHLKNNTAVICLYENDSLVKFTDSENYLNHFETIPVAFLYNDTLQISFRVGFFAGMEVGIKVNHHNLISTYQKNAGDDLVFKYNKNDTSYTSSVEVKANAQSFMISKRTALKKGDVLTGQFEGTFSPLYEKENSEDQLKIVRTKIIFKCVVS